MTVLRTSYATLAADVRALLVPGRCLHVEVGPPGPVDLRTVGEVARLHLLALRRGARLSVEDRAGLLSDLLALAGLDRVGPAGPWSGQADGQPEAGEQLGADEVVDVADPPV